MSYHPSDTDSQTQAYFNYELVDFSNEQIQLRLNFSEPLTVSTELTPDTVMVRLSKAFFL